MDNQNEWTTSETTLVTEAIERLLLDHADDSEHDFLTAQFDAGLAWVHFPAGLGGRGLSPSLQKEIDDRLDAANRRADWLRNAMGIGMVGPCLAALGTDEQKQHLRGIFTADEIWCQLFSEPGAGSDLATLGTRAVQQHDGTWVINGQKVWTSSGAISDFGLLIARSDPKVTKHDGLTAFIVDMHAEGVDVRPLRQIRGNADFSEVFLTDVRISDSQRVGKVGDGWKVAIATLMNERVSIGGRVSARGAGPIAGVLEAWKSVPQHNAVQRDEVAKLWIRAEVIRLNAIRSQQLRQAGTPGPEGSVLKLALALLRQACSNLRVDLLGAAGMLMVSSYDDPDTEEPVVVFLTDQSATIAGGTPEIMKNIIGERVLGLPKEPSADKDVPWADIPKGA